MKYFCQNEDEDLTGLLDDDEEEIEEDVIEDTEDPEEVIEDK